MAAPDSEEEVVLVDWNDREIGRASKLSAHQNHGQLHRSISVLVFDSHGRLLLQRRALSKYHGGGIWSNTCCSHPRPGETTTGAAHRRLREEMGFDCELKEVFTFTYEVPVGGGMTEREFDHVFFGRYDGAPRPDPAEVADFRWASPRELYASIRLDSREYSPWFKIILVHMAHSESLSLPEDTA